MASIRMFTKVGNNTEVPGVETLHAIEDDVLFIDNLRKVANLSTVRLSYNSVVYCRAGRILVEVGGNRQIKVKPGQLLLIPTGKLIQPMLMSTDVDAAALLVSDKMLRSVLGNQINVWNEAMYMKEIYVVEEAGWIESLGSYTQSIFKERKQPLFYREILLSFLRTMFLMICDELIRDKKVVTDNEVSTIRDKEIFNQFLQLIGKQNQKRQRVSFYADSLNITPKYLSMVCKKVSSKNPMRWITESVMEDCYMLLKDTDLSVKEISNRLGFPNSSFFGQYFREQAGMTPIEYRVKQQKM